MGFITLYQLDKTHSTGSLLGRLRQLLGCIYLCDAGQPVIGIYPKTLYVGALAADKWLKLQRQHANFGYDLVTFEQQSAWFGDMPRITPHQGTAQVGFEGGWMGYIGYDLAAARHGIEPCIENLADAAVSCAHATVDLLWGEYDVVLRQDAEGWFLAVTDDFADTAVAAYGAADADANDKKMQQIRRHPAIADLIARLTQAVVPSNPSNPAKSSKPFRLAHRFRARWTLCDYQHRFAAVQRYLYAGDAYQINLTQAFYATLQGDADCDNGLWQLADELWQLTRAPFAAYVRFDWAAIGGSAQQVFELCSCSPELFIAFEGKRRLVTRPIKGTLVRLPDADADNAQRQRLADSSKDQAENVMIVDLLRNDLSKYAEIGSVRVPQLFEIESFEQVHHMVSEIEATLGAEVNLMEVLLESLPGGSITGAPKIRAMQIIAELEQRRRGAYCGSVGYLNHDGRGRFNILIRTVQRSGQQVEVAAGGGITVASDGAAEYQESIDKVAAILHCINAYAPLSSVCLSSASLSSVPSMPESTVHADEQSPQ